MTWIYTGGSGENDYVDGYTSTGWAPQSNIYGAKVTFAQAGTVDNFGVWGQEGTTSTVAIKIAMYDTSGNLVSGSSQTITMNDTIQWHDSGVFTAFNVSAATYFIFCSAANSNAFYGYDSAFDGTSFAEVYANFPVDPDTWTDDNETSTGFGRRANFTASGGGGGTDTQIFIPTGPPV